MLQLVYTGRIYVWADTHFNHTKIITMQNRPYETIQDMNAGLVARWNETVGPDDLIIFIGDFGYSHKKMQPLGDIYHQLRGRKHLVLGNHDEKCKEVLRLPWETINDSVYIKNHVEDGVAMTAHIHHYPIESWRNMKNAIMVHGHCHGNLRRKMARRFDAGCDIWQNPQRLYDLAVAAAAQQPEADVDHHTNLAV